LFSSYTAFDKQGKTTLMKLMSGELLPTLGDIRPHGHLKLGRFTQHFVDVLNMDQTPLEFFESKYPNDPREEQRKYLGRFGVSGSMQVQRMADLSDGQKSRVVLAKLGRDVPHILLMDEPTNHLDMEGIDALAKAINEFEGGLVLVSHDMRLISQVAKEIWICDHKTIEKYKGDIQSFKMDMRAQMGIEGEQVGKLRGDASTKKQEAIVSNGTAAAESKPKNKAQPSKLEVVIPPTKAPSTTKGAAAATIISSKAPPSFPPVVMEDDATASTSASSFTAAENGGGPGSLASSQSAPSRYVPPHLRRKQQG
jgi:ATP-binding cassette subfamily F protein 2